MAQAANALDESEFELLVQIPFLGRSWLQALFGVVAISMTVLALRAKRAGWWPARLSRGLRRRR